MITKVQGPAARRLPPNAGKGREKGSKNKITRDLKEMILGALDDAGGRQYLTAQAKTNAPAFLALIGKVLPKELTGKDGGPIAGSLTVSVVWEDAPPR